MTVRRTRFDGPLCLFLFSAIWGAWIAYDSAAAARCFAFICGGLALYYLLALMPSRVAWRGADLPLLRSLLGVTPAFIAAYFILTNDWAQPAEKLRWLDPVREPVGALQPRLGWPRLHPNVAGGVLAMLLPLQVAALLPRRRAGDARLPAGFLKLHNLLLVGTSCAGLLLSGLRGAWLALAVATVVALWWQVIGRLRVGHGAWVGLAVRMGGLAGAVALLVGTPAGWGWLALRPDRVQVWRNSWDLARDYAFTGAGLGSFSMVYSSYVLLLHVPHTAHAHNLALDIWLAQGLVGLLAFAWLLLSAFGSLAVTASGSAASRSGHAPRWRAAAAASLLVILVHGLVDDIYYGHGGVGSLLLFVPFALLTRRSAGTPPHAAAWSRHRAAIASAGAAAILLLALVAAPRAVRAQFEANLGALSQTSAELSVYRWPQWPLQDALRRSDAVSLDAALRHYDAALALDPGNVTANRRLGQIELSRGQYDLARRHLDAAYRAAPGQQATRQLLGECRAVAGDVAGAAELWRTLALTEGQLAIRRFWYDSIGDRVRAESVRTATRLAGR